MARTLYICYFGLREPLVQTQVIPYLLEIAKDDIKVSLLTFEPESDRQWEEEKRLELAGQGIDWHWLRYHKRPSAIATAYDIFRGVLFISRFLAREKVDLLHGRVHVPTLMGAIARKFSRRKPKLLFDIRGFFPEEYTDAGVWPEGGWLYRAAKRLEGRLFKESDAFVVLTEKAKDIIIEKLDGKPIEVIPCCVDFDDRFRVDSLRSRSELKSKLGVGDRFVVTHVGALGGLYLTEEIVAFIDAARTVKPDTFALFLTQTDPTNIVKLLREKGFTEQDYFVGKVAAGDVPAYLSLASVGLSFVKATYATQSRSPTKIPEYLAAGVPLIANSGVGDVDKLIRENSVGVLIDKFERETYIDAVKNILTMNDSAQRCNETARRCFDLETIGGECYRRLYKKMLDG